MTIINLIISLLFLSGFYIIGKSVSKFIRITLILEKISKMEFQYSVLGIAYFIFLLFPIFFFGFYNKIIFLVVSLFIIFLGFLNIVYNLKSIKTYYKKILKLFSEKDIFNYLIYSLLTLYFFLSISPVTSGDSVAYHLGAAKYILKNGNFPTDIWNIENSFVGAGEFLNAFALSVSALQFTSLINFAGLVSILGLIDKFSFQLKLNKDNKQILFLLILSCPVLIFLISSSKSQLYSISLIIISYILLISSLNNNFNKGTLIKKYFLINIFLIVAIHTKISFLLSSFLILLVFFLAFAKKINFMKLIFISTLLFTFSLFPAAIWKQTIYDYPFYNFFINPLPLNVPGYIDAYLHSKNYLSEKFPLSVFLPLSFSDFTQFIGIGCLALIYLVKFNFQKKYIFLLVIFIFILLSILFGQKTPRFFLEIYFLIIFLFSMIIKEVNKTKFYKIFKFGVLSQSLFVLIILAFGVYILFPGNITKNLNERVLSNYASGYNLYNWANRVLPENSVTLIYHRSNYFAKKNIIFFGMPFFLDKSDIKTKKYFLEKIKQKKPNFILFYGFDENYNFGNFNFKNCLSDLFIQQENIGFHETRNIFNTNKRFYNGYIYRLENEKLPSCVKFD